MGGRARAGMRRDPIQANLLFTIDAINKRFPFLFNVNKPISIGNPASLATTWLNYYQKSDQGTLFGVKRLTGNEYAAASNRDQFVADAELRQADLSEIKDLRGLTPAQKVANAHFFIMGVKRIQDEWIKQLRKLSMQTRSSYDAGF